MLPKKFDIIKLEEMKNTMSLDICIRQYFKRQNYCKNKKIQITTYTENSKAEQYLEYYNTKVFCNIYIVCHMQIKR